jgi:hypothetical protein
MLRGIVGRLVAAFAVAAVLAAAHIPAAFAAGPGRWEQSGRRFTSGNYWQGITFDPGARTFFFNGMTGLYRTTASLAQERGVSNVIPSTVKRAERYNHLGDISFDSAPGGRLLLPLECFYRGRRGGSNTCQTGSIAVADPDSLLWQYYVKLDPAYIKKAMWVEVSPDGRWIWTSSERNLLAYSAAEVNPVNKAPAGPKLVPKQLTSVLPVSGVSGATFLHGRLFLALNRGSSFQVVSYGIDTTGPAPVLVDGPRPEIVRKASRPLIHETEGLATAGALNGELHWQIQPMILPPLLQRLIGRAQLFSYRPAS